MKGHDQENWKSEILDVTLWAPGGINHQERERTIEITCLSMAQFNIDTVLKLKNDDVCLLRS